MLKKTNALKETKGFTLIELMIVVIIIAVLAAIAIPLYTGYIKNARTSEGTARLGSILTAAKAYHERYGYWPAQDADNFYGDFDPSEHFSYEVVSGANGQGVYVLRATGTGADGIDAGITVTMTCDSVAAGGDVVVDGI